MVTFTPCGRLGNFLFEAASAMAYAWDHGLQFTVPTQTNDPYWSPIYLTHLQDPSFDPSLPTVKVVEKQFPWHEREFREEWRHGHNIVLEGFWQSEKYFKKYRDRIIKAFGYPWTPTKNTVSVHVRRGDYLTITRGQPMGGRLLKHPEVTPDWYRRQMAKFPGAKFYFFSDDIEWCKREFSSDPNCLFTTEDWVGWSEFTSQNTPEERDIIGISCCTNHINSASTFAWWGSWLGHNPSKRVIFPKHWITPGWDKIDYSEVVPESWERAQ